MNLEVLYLKKRIILSLTKGFCLWRWGWGRVMGEMLLVDNTNNDKSGVYQYALL